MKDQTKLIHTRDVHVTGDFGMFADPLFRADRISYLYPTYSGILGLAKNIFNKPEIGVDVLAVKVLTRPRHTTISVNQRLAELSGGTFTRLSEEAFILNPSYIIRIGLYPVVDGDIRAMTGKYANMLDRAISSGGRMKPCIGTSNCPADVSHVTKSFDEYTSELVGEHHHGVMYHHHDAITDKRWFVRDCVTVDGVIDFTTQWNNLKEVSR